MPPSNPVPPPSVANTVPATYTNIATFTYINGLFRVTFFEQNLTGDIGATSVAVTESTVPRTAVIMTPATFADFLRIGGELYNRVAAAARAGGLEVSEGSDTLQ